MGCGMWWNLRDLLLEDEWWSVRWRIGCSLLGFKKKGREAGLLCISRPPGAEPQHRAGASRQPDVDPWLALAFTGLALKDGGGGCRAQREAGPLPIPGLRANFTSPPPRHPAYRYTRNAAAQPPSPSLFLALLCAQHARRMSRFFDTCWPARIY